MGNADRYHFFFKICFQAAPPKLVIIYVWPRAMENSVSDISHNGCSTVSKNFMSAMTPLYFIRLVGRKWVFPKIGVPQNGWFIVENPIKMDDLGVSLSLQTPKYQSTLTLWRKSMACFFWPFRDKTSRFFEFEYKEVGPQCKITIWYFYQSHSLFVVVTSFSSNFPINPPPRCKYQLIFRCYSCYVRFYGYEVGALKFSNSFLPAKPNIHKFWNTPSFETHPRSPSRPNFVDLVGSGILYMNRSERPATLFGLGLSEIHVRILHCI